MVDPTSDTFRVIGIDPGSYKTGFSALSYGYDNTVKAEHVFTSDYTGKLPRYHDLALIHGERQMRVQCICDDLKDLIDEFQPHWIISESPFAKHIQTYAVLTECVAAFRAVSMAYDPYVPFEIIDPISAKRNIGVKLGKGSSKERKDKDLVEKLVRQRKDLIGFDKHVIDEHCSDATAIGLVVIDRMFGKF